ncbi:beta-propeller fold lactonase family protein [Intrasporangium sp.]|uniref:lactonase family protein n=1 Tax=Intrasporangium sp. TaxID=1925024 RepID=UPI003221997A
MMLRRSGLVAALAAGALALGLGLAPAASAATPLPADAARVAAAPHRPDAPRPAPTDRHAVFVQTNDPAGNAVVVYARDGHGQLRQTGRYPTGGRGGSEPGAVVDPLASQGSLTYDRSHHLLLAVNAGSDTLTVFRVHGDRLHRVQVLPTRGHLPVSVSAARDLVYVLDAGGDGAVTGFWVLADRLVPIPGSTRSLGLGNPVDPQFLASPSQLALTPDGRDLVVATKTHGTLQVFPLSRFGRPGAQVVTPAAGQVPFALTFDRQRRLQVADASGGVYSYTVHRDGTLTPVSPFVANGQVATCWSVSVGGYLYAANAGSATITGYRAGRHGVLSLLDPSGVTARTDAGPVDLAASSDGRYLYQQATGAGTIDEFRIGADGSLTRIGTVTGWAPDNGTGAEGIAAS